MSGALQLHQFAACFAKIISINFALVWAIIQRTILLDGIKLSYFRICLAWSHELGRGLSGALAAFPGRGMRPIATFHNSLYAHLTPHLFTWCSYNLAHVCPASSRIIARNFRRFGIRMPVWLLVCDIFIPNANIFTKPDMDSSDSWACSDTRLPKYLHDLFTSLGTIYNI